MMVGGLLLEDPGKYCLTVVTQPHSAPSYQYVSTPLPDVDGELVPDAVPFAPGSITIGVKVTGATAAENRQLVDKLKGAFMPIRGLAEIGMVGADGESRVNWGRLARPLDIEQVADTMTDVRAEFTLPKPFWRGPVGYQELETGAMIINGLRGGNAPVDYAVTFTGNVTSWKLRDYGTGEATAWAGPAPGTSVITVAGWAAKAGIPDEGGGVSNPDRTLSKQVTSVGRIYPLSTGAYALNVPDMTGWSGTLVYRKAWL